MTKVIIKKETSICKEENSKKPKYILIKYSLPKDIIGFSKKNFNINALMDVGFLFNNNIPYIIDKETKLPIPIGIIDFIHTNDNQNLYNDTIIKIPFTKHIYKCKQYLELIDKAIKIKYEEFKLYNKCKSKYQENLILE